MRVSKTRKTFAVEEGETLFEAGSEAVAAFFVVEGLFEASMTRVGARSRAVRVVGPGGFIGDTAIVQRELASETDDARAAPTAHEVSATATKRARVVAIPAADFLRAWRARPSAARRRAEEEARRRLRFFREVSDALRKQTRTPAAIAAGGGEETADARSGAEDDASRRKDRKGEDAAVPSATIGGSGGSGGSETRARGVSLRRFTCAAGCVIAARGEPASGAFRLIRGAVCETVDVASARASSVATYAAGDVFAYTSLALRRPRRVTSFVATEACEFRRVSRDAFLSWLDEDADLRERVTAHAAAAEKADAARVADGIAAARRRRASGAV